MCEGEVNMKKVISLILVVILAVIICGCNSGADVETEKETKYTQAVAHLKNDEYEEALALFEELAVYNYKDSSGMILETKYQFVADKKDAEDATVHQYLKELVLQNYKASIAIFDALYGWKFEIAFSTTQKSMLHQGTVYATSQTFPFYFINFRVTGGEPEESLHGWYEVEFSNGAKARKEFYDGNGNVLSIVLSATENPRGLTIFSLYGDNGELLAIQSACIV